MIGWSCPRLCPKSACGAKHWETCPTTPMTQRAKEARDVSESWRDINNKMKTVMIITLMFRKYLWHFRDLWYYRRCQEGKWDNPLCFLPLVWICRWTEDILWAPASPQTHNQLCRHNSVLEDTCVGPDHLRGQREYFCFWNTCFLNWYLGEVVCMQHQKKNNLIRFIWLFPVNQSTKDWTGSIYSLSQSFTLCFEKCS